MQPSCVQLRDDARAIWQAAVDGVDSRRLVRQVVRIEDGALWIGDELRELAPIERIAVVGAGKAGAGMAAGLEQVLGETWLRQKRVSGWVNVPDDCVTTLKAIVLHAARPAGRNEPTEAGVEGAERILERVAALGPRDLCFCLLSGGGSALLPAPVPGVSLSDKQRLTRDLSAAGANIRELNTVRKQLSRIKGGGLARACRAGELVTLIISDVIGDPLDVIASGPTVPDPSTPREALEVLNRLLPGEGAVPAGVLAHLGGPAPSTADAAGCRVTNLVIGNNGLAVDQAGIEAERRGYAHAMVAARELEGPAEAVGKHLATMAWRMRHKAGPDCLITGGEPVVELVPESERGIGGRNQQLVLAALVELLERHPDAENPLAGIVLLAGGTDGEDGPTDAAGAWIDAEAVRRMRAASLDPRAFLRTNNAYPFFAQLGRLIRTGPTHTNVCDVRVVTVSSANG